jgi:hypothetical protein
VRHGGNQDGPDPKAKSPQQNGSLLAVPLTLARDGRRWVESTNGNRDYRTVRRARDPLVHGIIRSEYLNEWPGGDASGRVVWAMMAANGLAYLLDIDDEARTHASRPQGWQAVHMAHTRWAATSAVTALDLRRSGARTAASRPQDQGSRILRTDVTVTIGSPLPAQFYLHVRAWTAARGIASPDRAGLPSGGQTTRSLSEGSAVPDAIAAVKGILRAWASAGASLRQIHPRISAVAVSTSGT